MTVLRWRCANVCPRQLSPPSRTSPENEYPQGEGVLNLTRIVGPLGGLPLYGDREVAGMIGSVTPKVTRQMTCSVVAVKRDDDSQGRNG